MVNTVNLPGQFVSTLGSWQKQYGSLFYKLERGLLPSFIWAYDPNYLLYWLPSIVCWIKRLALDLKV